jgi:pimeloyl-ACP methyl ester carboxylesterase
MRRSARIAIPGVIGQAGFTVAKTVFGGGTGPAGIFPFRLCGQAIDVPVGETPARARWAFFSADFPEEQLLKYHAQMNEESFRMFLDLLGLNLAHPKRVKTPLLVLGAEKDTVISQRDVRATAQAHGTRAEFFPNMAHDMMLEAGWKSVAERILAWLGEKGI